MSSSNFPKWVEELYADAHIPSVYEAPDEEEDSSLEKVDILLGEETLEELYSF